MKQTEIKLENGARVFLMNFAGHDITDAYRFSEEVIPLTEDQVKLSNTDRVKFEIQKKLDAHSFNPSVDFIAVSGSPVLSALIMRVLKNHDSIKLLIFNAKTREYYVRHV